jgi:hypothetical protein
MTIMPLVKTFPVICSFVFGLALAGCGAAPADNSGSSDIESSDEDPQWGVSDGKTDAFEPTSGGAEFSSSFWGHRSHTVFDPSDKAMWYYLKLRSSGEADLDIEVLPYQTDPDDGYPVEDDVVNSEASTNIDTVLYVYNEPKNHVWGQYIAKDDNSGTDGRLSKLAVHLAKGTYYVVLRRKSTFHNQRAVVDIVANCSGDACRKPSETPVDAGAAPTCSDPNDLECLVGNAIEPLGEPDLRLCKKVTLEEMPSSVRATAKDVATEIEAREFEGTDYQAEIQGYYAIYQSESDHTIVGYAVWGTGTGEPDYMDGIVVGIDLDGNRVCEMEDQG